MNISPPKRVCALPFLVFFLGLYVAQFNRPAIAESIAAPVYTIWATMSQSIVGFDPETMAPVGEILLQHDPDALAVDSRQQRVWVYHGDLLASYSFSGELISQRKLRLPHGKAISISIDENEDALWLLSRGVLLRLDSLGDRSIVLESGVPVKGAYDVQQKIFWIAQGNTLSAFAQDGAVRKTLDLDAPVQTLAYDTFDKSLKFVAGDSLYRLHFGGEPLELLADRRIRQSRHLLVGQGGVTWIADDHNVFKVTASGEMTVYRPLQHFSPEIIVDIAPAEDGGLWIANWRELVRLEADGKVVGVIYPTVSGKRKRNFLALAEKNENVGPKLLVLYPDEASFINSASPELVVKLENTDIAIDSVEVIMADSVLSVSCEAQDSSALCHFDSLLSDGDYELTITASNTEGQRSMPVELHFQIDTRAPHIAVNSPENGLVTGADRIPISGSTDEFSAVSISGNTVSLDQANRFTLDAFVLAEGRNLILIEAVDRASNVSQASIEVWRDTTPPEQPNISLIEVSFLPDGLVQLVGESGSVEPGSELTVINTRSGEAIVVQADETGSFSLEIRAQERDILQISATDSVGNQSAKADMEVVVQPGAAPLELSFMSPQNNENITGDTILVRVHLAGPDNAGVKVNDNIATIVPNPDGSVTAYAWVPVSLGSTTLTATATAMDDREVSSSIIVHQQQAPYFRVSPSNYKGIGPLTVSFEIRDLFGTGVSQIHFDADGDGQSDRIYSGERDVIEYAYDGSPGLKPTTFIISDKQGNTHQVLVPILILDEEVLDSRIRQVWGGMIDALNAGDKEKALRFMVGDSREKYGAIFEVLMPYMAEITAGFSDIYQLGLYSEMASYVLMTAEEDEPRVFVAQFMIDRHGIWRIESF